MSLVAHASTSRPGGDQDPFRILKLVIAGLLILGTLVALFLWVTGVSRGAIVLVGTFWALYGLVMATIDGVLEPVIEFSVTALQNAGLIRHGGGYSALETLEARGFHDAAATGYLERAHQDGDLEAMLRRARILAGPLATPEAAVAELQNFRTARRLGARDDIRLGLALADLYEQRLAEPGRAMGELRRLLDLHPPARRMPRVRSLLARLRQDRFHPDG